MHSRFHQVVIKQVDSRLGLKRFSDHGQRVLQGIEYVRQNVSSFQSSPSHNILWIQDINLLLS
jgi:hypothetical protein